MSSPDWQEKQHEEAIDLIEKTHQALQQDNLVGAETSIDEAGVILDMVEEETDAYHQLRARACNEQGVLLQRREMWEEALAAHRRAAQEAREIDAPDAAFVGHDAAIHVNLARLLLDHGDMSAAREANERALETIEASEEAGLESLALSAHLCQAAIEGTTGNFDEAEASTETAVERGKALAQQGNPGALVQAAQACQQLSVMLFESNDHERALDWGTQAVGLSEQAYNSAGEPALRVYVISQINQISFHEAMEDFAKAEDALWKAIDVAGPDPEILRRGKAFYEQCRKYTDKKLESGDLPRDEVEMGREDLQAEIDGIGGLPAAQRPGQPAQRPGRGPGM
jgi:tetratricopeptide (TPR) repeat protein